MECLLIRLTGGTKHDMNQHEDNEYAISIRLLMWLFELFKDDFNVKISEFKQHLSCTVTAANLTKSLNPFFSYLFE